MAFDMLEPIGEMRADYRAGIIASTLANIHRNRKQKTDPYSVHDFMHFIQPDERKQADNKSLSMKIKSIFQRFGRG